MTLAAIDAALYAALAVTQHNGTATDAAPFALVGRYAGELTPDGIREASAQYPCAFLRWDSGAATRTVDAVEGVEDAAVETWTVLVAVEEPRAIDDAISATATLAPGALTLIDAVLGACNGLVFDGAWRDRRVRCAGYAPALVKRGEVYVYAVRFEAKRALPQLALTVAQAGTGQDLTQIAGDVDLEGTADTAPNPIVQFQTF